MSNIEWTDKSWNPIVGCSVVSPGCTNCYAMRDAWIRHHNPKTPHYRDLTFRGRLGTKPPHWTGKVARAPESVWLAPLKRRTPTVYFVNSMGDLFHENVPDAWIDEVFAVMALCPQHIFQVLTKRPERMRQYMARFVSEQTAFNRHFRWLLTQAMRRESISEGVAKARVDDALARVDWDYPLANVWLGVSAEDQPRFDVRVAILGDTPAAVRFVSLEPLLGPVDARSALGVVPLASTSVCAETGALHGEIEICWTQSYNVFTHDRVQPSIDWVIVGGESGPDARPMHPDWARTLRDQCAAAGVPFFFKQWGEWQEVGGGPPHSRIEVDATREPRPGMFGARMKSGDIAISVCGHIARDLQSLKPDLAHRHMCYAGKKATGRTLDGRTHDDMPAGVRVEKAA